MDLHEAVGKAHQEMNQTAKYRPEEHNVFTLSYQGMVQAIIWEEANKVAKTFVSRAVPASVLLADDDPLHEVLVTELVSCAMDACWSFFVLGWVLGTPENQALPRTRHVFAQIMEGISDADLDVLEARFRDERFLAERFLRQFKEAGTATTTMFASDQVEMSAGTLQNWCAIASSIPMFCAYELGLKSRTLIEEDAILALYEREM